ncbi:hypothetical protein ABZ567_21150 [Streptomyces sp. NPDC016459]|uniref:hypothetical protein n=1 Tax=Streptomyces sp. NPDC016459 TaxID=3157190 RepID=UPI00340D4561
MSQANGASGASPTRRGGRWERYRVTHPFSARDLALLWGSIAGVLAVALLLGWALDMKGGVVLVAAAPFIVSWFEKRRTAFQFDAAGARFGEVLLPWSDITQFVVSTPPGEEYALIGARLRPGASLPHGAPVPPRNEELPVPIHVAVPRSRFDLTKMARKARTYAPSHVRIVIAEPSGERPAV